MPLKKSRTKAALQQNISTLIKEGRPKKQAIAIAYSIQRRSGKKK